MKHTCLRKIKYMLQDFVVETADDNNDENDDDDYESCGSLPSSASSFAVTALFLRREKKLRMII